jgi:hypothetical protein
MVAVTVVSGMFLAAFCLALPPRQSSSTKGASLRTFLRTYLRLSYDDYDKTTRYFPAFVDLKDDGTQEVIVYVTGDAWCGSGGCTMLVLAPHDSSYEVITRTTITRDPIRVLATTSNGWHDIGVGVGGGGILDWYQVELRFDGKTYPSNPSMPPARRLPGKVAGKIVIPATRGMLLY